MRKVVNKMKIEGLKKYLREEKSNIQTDGEKDNKTLKCPLCGMTDFVHAGGGCELDMLCLILNN